jgi:hypothetical protein
MGKLSGRWSWSPIQRCGITPACHRCPFVGCWYVTLRASLHPKRCCVLTCFVLRWQLEVTFEEVRAHLGLESQRQWSDLAIARTTPALLGLFSLVTILAGQLTAQQEFPLRQAAWYAKAQPTFVDALAVVRRYLCQQDHFCISPEKAETVKIPRSLLERFTDTLCYAA